MAVWIMESKTIIIMLATGDSLCLAIAIDRPFLFTTNCESKKDNEFPKTLNCEHLIKQQTWNWKTNLRSQPMHAFYYVIRNNYRRKSKTLSSPVAQVNPCYSLTKPQVGSERLDEILSAFLCFPSLPLLLYQTEGWRWGENWEREQQRKKTKNGSPHSST